MARHLTTTPEAFVELVRTKYGPAAVLHPANRLTSCGRPIARLIVTTEPARATCRTCAASAARVARTAAKG